jgi:hypothetical protein
MNRLLKITLVSCVIILSLTDLLYAGVLDRQNAQPRTNDATKSMIRVPGVVGQDQASAMSALQQAGLNISVLEAKKMPKGMEGAANMEGKVVDQTPVSGGMAMYGTTVSIYVWKPKEVPSSGGEIPAGNSWGTGNYSSSNPSQSTYSGTQVQPQVYQPMGTTGTTTQTSQPFQVQQYYYPSAGDASGSNQQNQMNQDQTPTDPNAYQQPADPNAYQQSVDTNTSQQTGTSEQALKEQQISTPGQ